MSSKASAKLFLVAFLALLLLVVLSVFYGPLSAWQWHQVPLHSTMETMGGMVAILIAMILFWEFKDKPDAHLVMVATGFATMGVLDTAHAISRAGDAFIFLHSAASLSCGFCFFSIWFTHGRKLNGRFERNFIFLGAIFLSLTIAFRALVFPDDVPRIMPLYQGDFTVTAVLINTVASLFYLASIPKFYRVYRQERGSLYLLCFCLAALFGLAEMIFMFSAPWNGMWWVWHLLRLTAFLVILIFVIRQYLDKLEAGKEHIGN